MNVIQNYEEVQKLKFYVKGYKFDFVLEIAQKPCNLLHSKMLKKALGPLKYESLVILSVVKQKFLLIYERFSTEFFNWVMIMHCGSNEHINKHSELL